MNKIIKNIDNNKYFTDIYQNGFWSKDIEDACLFESEPEIRYYVTKLMESMDNPFEDVKTMIIETIYKLKN